MNLLASAIITVMHHRLWVIAIITASLSVVAGFLANKLEAQPGPIFTVVTPQQGTVFHPGDSVTVAVSPSVGITLAVVNVTSPIGSATEEPAVPVQLTIPETLVGFIKIHIVCATQAGAGSDAYVTIDSEPATPAQNILVSPQSLSLAVQGTSTVFSNLTVGRLSVIAQYPGESDLDLSRSSLTTYMSSNPRVATVDFYGHVTAVAPGVATITVSNEGITNTATVQVNVFELRGDLNGDGDVDQDDLNILLKALNTSATGPGDPRDLNSDGKIDAVDARILTNLCSRPRCATK